MTLVKIDRFTIRKNPNAGRTEFFVPGIPQGSISVRFACHPDILKERFECFKQMLEADECVLISWKCDNSMVEIDAALHPGIDAKAVGDRIKKAIDDDPLLAYRSIKANWEADVLRYRTLTPDPDFLFRYVPTVVECAECHERFDYSDLESDEIDDDIWSDRVCPKCHAFDCCELEFENLTQEMTAAVE